MLCRGLNKIKIVTFPKQKLQNGTEKTWEGKMQSQKKRVPRNTTAQKNDGKERVERRVPSIIFKQTIKLNHFTSSTLPMPGSWCCLPPWIRQAKTLQNEAVKKKRQNVNRHRHHQSQAFNRLELV